MELTTSWDYWLLALLLIAIALILGMTLLLPALARGRKKALEMMQNSLDRERKSLARERKSLARERLAAEIADQIRSEIDINTILQQAGNRVGDFTEAVRTLGMFWLLLNECPECNSLQPKA